MKRKQKNKWMAVFAAAMVGAAAICGCGESGTAKSSQESKSSESLEADSGEESLSGQTDTDSGKDAKDSSQADKESTTRTVTDAAGNVVEVPSDLSKIAVTPIPWSSVIYAIDGTEEHMLAINPTAINASKGHFLETMAPKYGQIDGTAIGKDFSINMEEMVNMGIQAVVLWDYQPDEAKQLTELGIVPVMVKNETVQELQDSIRAIGQLLGKEERAQQFIDLYEDTYQKIQSYQEQVSSAEKPKVLYLRTKELKLQGNDNFIKEALELAGADNVAAEGADITMEEILQINPDIILLSWFDDFTPDDLYNNTIDGQDWSTVNAVINRQVYKTPNGIYRWDAPGVETPLMMEWLATLIQPEIFNDIDIRQEVKAYFKEYFDWDLTEEELSQILSDSENSNSAL